MFSDSDTETFEDEELEESVSEDYALVESGGEEGIGGDPLRGRSVCFGSCVLPQEQDI